MGKEKNYIDLGERGHLNKNNKLNNLTGKEWIKFTKSWFIHSPRSRNKEEILHPAKYPESLIEDFIIFFTKEDEWVFDPFLGTGSTLVAAANTKRNAAGVELMRKYFNLAKKRINKCEDENKIIPMLGNSLQLKKLLDKANLSEQLFDYVITSPPYWNQLKQNSMRQKDRTEKGLDTKYSSKKNDLGNIDDYEKFVEEQAKVFDNVYDITKNNGYLTVITNNVFYKGRVYPLAFDTATSLTKRGKKSWIMKDEKIWLQNDKRLVALGINHAWVGNRHHQYCLIFRKEENG